MRSTSLAFLLTSFVTSSAFAQGVLDPPGSDVEETEPLPPPGAAPAVPPPAPVGAPVDTPPVETTPVEAPIAVPEPPPPLTAPEVVGYGFGYDNGFFLQTPDQNNRLRIRGLVQPRFALLAADPDATTWTASFAVQRAQIELVGNVFTRALGFTLKTEFGRGEAFMKDAFLDARIAPDTLVRAGLWKRPFSRQQLTADWRMAFLERSITDAAFGAGRDIGVAVQADVDRNPAFEWHVGLFSGASDRGRVTGDVIIDPENGAGSLENVKVSNVPRLFTPTFAGRIGYNFGEVFGYSEIDLDGGAPRFGIAASMLEGVDIAGIGGSSTRLQTDAMFKWEGVTVSGAGFMSLLQNDPRSFAQSFDKVGGYLQAGVLVLDVWHPGLRYSIVAQPSANLVEHEMLANVTLLIFSQNVLIGAEAGSNVGVAGPDARVRVQGQLQF